MAEPDTKAVIVKRLNAEIEAAAKDSIGSLPANRAMKSLQSLLEDVRAEILRLRSELAEVPEK